MNVGFARLAYEHQEKQVSWHGYCLLDNADFNLFMANNVAVRLNDEEGTKEFEALLQSLPITGFGKQNLEEVLSAIIPEEREWAIGEAIAEAWLINAHEIIWPWNTERDKKNPNSSLPGADLVGFMQVNSETFLVLGEVKSSYEEKYPPGVMTGRSGMKHQIDNLVTDVSIISQLLKWLHFRCKNTQFQPLFESCVVNYVNSGKKALSLFGVLIRDTCANELDLKSRSMALSKTLEHPTSCKLIALYMPCKIADLPTKVKREEEDPL